MITFALVMEPPAAAAARSEKLSLRTLGAGVIVSVCVVCDNLWNCATRIILKRPACERRLLLALCVFAER